MMKITECPEKFCDAQYFLSGTLEDLLNEKGQFFRFGETPTYKCPRCKKIAKEFEFR